MKSVGRRSGSGRVAWMAGGALLVLIGCWYAVSDNADTLVANGAEGVHGADAANGRSALPAPDPQGREGRASRRGVDGRKAAHSGAETVVPPSGNARDVVAQLRPRAEAGDARAALLIHLKLYECANLQSVPAMEQAAEAYERAGASGSTYIADQQRIRKDCASSAELLSEQAKWLEQAADGGDTVAQMLYASNPGVFFRSATDMLADPAGLERYKQKANGYMSALVGQGNIEAMMWYAGAYDSGVMLAKDPMRSYAYYRLVEMSAPGTISRESMDYQASRIPDGKKVEADALASELYSDCCKN
ncbi:hypothetical protein J5226_20150 [Lysobacter sp. K5869]|uniref:hypothetical protein n=1 Tax=Lysobacter sp. K5869 TaxID=2820808 RepID=UPI001C061155|nr:hypothetical protein [Lysobacter sp. K5869]QWP75895.1 hypothetical protein J5226_20150 [Lysobacter sp. K5869]